MDFVITEKRPNLTAGEWIEDAKHFSIKNYAEITALEMLWHFGLGPRPKDMDPAILALDMLNQVRPFVVLSKGSSYIAAAQTSKGGPTAPSTTEEVEEEKDGGLQQRKSKQPRSEPDKGAPLNVLPLPQVPLLPPSSIFLGILLFFKYTTHISFCLTHS